MTEQTIRIYAKELAAKHYEWVRSIEDADPAIQNYLRNRVLKAGQIDPLLVGKIYPTVKDYLAGRVHGRREILLDGTERHVDDGSVTQGIPGWKFHEQQARAELVAMLGMPHVSENTKQGIHAAIVEDRENQLKQEAMMIRSPKIPQRLN